MLLELIGRHSKRLEIYEGFPKGPEAELELEASAVQAVLSDVSSKEVLVNIMTFI